MGWLYKCEQFFDIDDTPVHAKVKMVAMHLEGKDPAMAPGLYANQDYQRTATVGRVYQGIVSKIR